MLPISQLFVDALSRSHTRVTQCWYTPPGGVRTLARWKSGSVQVDDTARTRRHGTMTLLATVPQYLAMRAPGTKFEVLHGIDFGATQELVPLLTGEAKEPVQDFGGGEVTVPLVDWSEWVGRSQFLTPFSPAANLTRAQAIQQIVSDALPTATFSVTTTDTGPVGVGKVWTGNRLDAIAQLATDGAMQAFFGPDGVFYIRNQPQFGDNPVWTARGVITQAARKRPADRMFNTVVVQPAATDGTQTWVQQVVEITDARHPLHKSKIGQVPKFIRSTTARTAAEAYQIGVARLTLYKGIAETLDLELIGNPALDGSDLVRLSIPSSGSEDAAIFQHQIDTLTIDLASGRMTAQTRNEAVDIAVDN